MDVDMSALRAIERDKEIPFDFLVKALEEAMLNAYDKTPHAQKGARVELDRKSGKVSVLVPELDEAGEVIGEADDTPADFGRVAAATARQVIFQRLRDAEDERKDRKGLDVDVCGYERHRVAPSPVVPVR